MHIDLLTPQIMGGIAGVIGVLVVSYLVRTRNLKIGEGRKMGLNLSADLKCPSCNELFPTFRRPKNFRQMMWGGWTCGKCGTECDKWLNPIKPGN